MKIEILEVSGLIPMVQAMRLSWNSESDSQYNGAFVSEDFTKLSISSRLGEKDVALLKKLIMAGDSHSKAFRLPVAYLKVTGTLSWWRHMDTYRYDVVLPTTDDELGGVDWEGASESTMHTLARKIIEERIRVEGKAGLSDEFLALFSNDTLYTSLLDYVGVVNVYQIECVQASLPGGFLQTRIGRLSYAALRRIYQDRRAHRLSEWREFCEKLVQLPYSFLITDKEW